MLTGRCLLYLATIVRSPGFDYHKSDVRMAPSLLGYYFLKVNQKSESLLFKKARIFFLVLGVGGLWEHNRVK